MERQEGYYWCKLSLYGESGYVIAKYLNDYKVWVICGHTLFFYDKDFDFINENRIKQPGELPD